MITSLLDETRFPLFEETPFTCRILATARAYGCNAPFAQFWSQDQRALLCLLDSVLIVEALEPADFAELQGFARFCGARRLLCSEQAARRLLYPTACMGPILTCVPAMGAPRFPFERDPSPRALHALLLACQTAAFCAPAFEPFYLDLSHRTRHGEAVSAGLCDSAGALAACAVCTAFSKSMAVVSAVAVRPELRRNGWGRRAVQALASLLPGRRLTVFCDQKENEAFYQSLGFSKSGAFRELTIEDKPCAD